MLIGVHWGPSGPSGSVGMRQELCMFIGVRWELLGFVGVHFCCPSGIQAFKGLLLFIEILNDLIIVTPTYPIPDCSALKCGAFHFTETSLKSNKMKIWSLSINKVFFLSVSFIMHPAQPSEARLGGVHFIFRLIQICTRLLQREQFEVTMYTAHISSNGSHFMTARVLVY